MSNCVVAAVRDPSGGSDIPGDIVAGAPATIGYATAEPTDATNSRRLMCTSRASGPALAGSSARLPPPGA
ncbi:MAG: hypothetical protein K0Q60_3613 [Microvirga sp.]|nr:hypothetical protein [Microvirga sp.]